MGAAWRMVAQSDALPRNPGRRSKRGGFGLDSAGRISPKGAADPAGLYHHAIRRQTERIGQDITDVERVLHTGPDGQRADLPFGECRAGLDRRMRGQRDVHPQIDVPPPGFGGSVEHGVRQRPLGQMPIHVHRRRKIGPRVRGVDVPLQFKCFGNGVECVGPFGDDTQPRALPISGPHASTSATKPGTARAAAAFLCHRDKDRGPRFVHVTLARDALAVNGWILDGRDRWRDLPAHGLRNWRCRKAGSRSGWQDPCTSSSCILQSLFVLRKLIKRCYPGNAFRPEDMCLRPINGRHLERVCVEVRLLRKNRRLE